MTLSTTEITNTVTVTENPDSITIVADNFTQTGGGGGGSGTVTSVSVTSANGVSGTVANATSTPAITISLGAITPTTVNGLTLTTSTGTVTITNLKTFAVTNTLTLSGTDGSTLNIGAGGTLGTAAFTAATAYLAVSNNLSDLASASTARTNLGLGTLATQSGTFSGTSSGTNTGDQTSIVGITGTFAQFNTAVTDADFARTSGTNTFTGTQTFSSVVSSGVSALFLDTGDDGNSGLFSVYSGIGVGTANLITSTATTTRNNELPDLDGTFLLTTGAQSIQDKTISGTDNTISNIAPASQTTAGKTFALGFTADGGGSAISTGKVKGFVTCPVGATIVGWTMTTDATSSWPVVKVWKIAAGTAKPTSANSINTSGVAISSGTHVRSSTLTDFTTTTVTAGDVFAFNIESNGGNATEITFTLELTKS